MQTEWRSQGAESSLVCRLLGQCKASLCRAGDSSPSTHTVAAPALLRRQWHILGTETITACPGHQLSHQLQGASVLLRFPPTLLSTLG